MTRNEVIVDVMVRSLPPPHPIVCRSRDVTRGEVRGNSLTQPGDQQLKGYFRTTTNDWAGGLLARTGSLSGHPSKQQPRSTLFDWVILL
ncbi:hypothetical protein J6590_026437 [Homalodisca vitripennis]|nr:hypothetical protein J6590_026437 [Homalodisca vitripennis]